MLLQSREIVSADNKTFQIRWFLLPSADQEPMQDHMFDYIANVERLSREAVTAEASRREPNRLYAAYANHLTTEDKRFLEQLSKQSSAPILLRAFSFRDGDLLAWCAQHRISFAPIDLAGMGTLENCLHAAARGEVALPTLQTAAGGGLSEFFRDLAECARMEKVALGVVALPRSGSKYVADQLVMWGAPDVKVFHTHGLNAARRAMIVGNPIKLRRFDRAHEYLNGASRRVIFLCERNPINRFLSEFALKYYQDISAYYQGKVGAVQLSERLDAVAAQEVSLLSEWYEELFQGVFDFDVRKLRPISQQGFAIVQLPELTVVALQTERSHQLLAEAGVAHPVVCRNSAESRGYGDDYTKFCRDFRLTPERADAITSVSIY